MKLDGNGRKRLDAMKKALAAGLPLAGLLATVDLSAGCGRVDDFAVAGEIDIRACEPPETQAVPSGKPEERLVVGLILSPGATAEGILAKMEKIHFPSIEFRNLPFADVIRFLSESFAANDTEKQFGVPILVSPRDAVATLPPITLKLEDVSFPNLAVCIAREAGLRAAIDEGALLFVAPGCQSLSPSAVFLDGDSP